MYAFSFFREFAPAFHLAISDDLIMWRELNEQEPILESHVSAGYWRDPFVIRDNSGVFHLLCTDGWASTKIIHASSKNLLDWSEQHVISVMQEFPSVMNVWAPEACYDHENHQFRIFWSSTVPDAFPDHVKKPKDYRNHRIYSCTTKDFQSFSKSTIFFDPGYNVIDASIGFNNGQYLMAFKDERGDNSYFPNEKARKHIMIATTTNLKGSWEIQGKPVSKSSYTEKKDNDKKTWAEGPCVFWNSIAKEWWIFYEYFRNNQYGAIKSKDGIQWINVENEIKFPEGSKHGTVFEVEDESIILQLKEKL
jgi:hypothetical protein